MNLKGIKYVFTAIPWQYNGLSSWYFISLPKDLSEEIRRLFKSEEVGWGRLNATAKIGKTEWKTSIWFDTKYKTYLLPLKSEIRKKEKLEISKEVKTTVWI